MATTAGGVDELTDDLVKPFTGRKVYLWPDTDPPGKTLIDTAKKLLKGVANSLWIVNLPSDVKDITEFVEKLKGLGKTEVEIKAEIDALIEQAQQVDFSTVEEAPTKTGGGFEFNEYLVWQDSSLSRWKLNEKKQEKEYTPLANFMPVIKEMKTVDDSVTQSIFYVVDIWFEGKAIKTITLPQKLFTDMGWVLDVEKRLYIEPGSTTKGHILKACKSHPESIASIEKLYIAHLGWKYINGKWVYITAGGAIGDSAVGVELPPYLRRYCMSQDVSREEAVQAARLVLDILKIGKPEIMYALITVAFMAVLTTRLKPMPDFATLITGRSGSFKTTLMLLCLSFFGDFSTPDHLANFSDTAAATERQMALCKDALYGRDDLHPSTSKRQAESMEANAQATVRSNTNRQAKKRANINMGAQPEYPPQCTLMMTAEDVLSNLSTVARLLIVEIDRGDIDQELLTKIQIQADQLPKSMCSYIKYLQKPEVESDIKTFKAKYDALRVKLQQEGYHGRMPGYLAFLSLNFGWITDWLKDIGAITETERLTQIGIARDAFLKVAGQSTRLVHAEDPVNIYRDLINTLIEQGQVYLNGRTSTDSGIGGSPGKAVLIGEVDDEHYYLIPWAVDVELRKRLNLSNVQLPKKDALRKALIAAGAIEPGSDFTAKAVFVDGKTQRRIVIKRSFFEGKPVGD